MFGFQSPRGLYALVPGSIKQEKYANGDEKNAHMLLWCGYMCGVDNAV